MVSKLVFSKVIKVVCFKIGPAVKFSEALNEPQSAPPYLGQHSEEVLAGILGYSPAKITDLKANKVIQS